jgi:sugar phosphate isomerase/epimerase
MKSRRVILTESVAVLAAALAAPLARAADGRGPLGRPIGLQLYTVREAAAKDLPGTLRAVAAIGYREVELAGLHGHSPRDVASMLKEAGLAAPAAHVNLFELNANSANRIAEVRELGVRHLVCSFPAARDVEKLAARPGGPAAAIMRGELTLDDWRWNAECLNRIGEAARAAELRFAYHNHAMEFRTYDGVVAFDEVLRLTDPTLVELELDCAWVKEGGHDPADYLRQHAARVSLLHIKDVKPAAPTFTTTEVGSGAIDWPRVFAAADPDRLAHYFVEQEHFERPPLEAVRTSFDYLSKLTA